MKASICCPSCMRAFGDLGAEKDEIIAAKDAEIAKLTDENRALKTEVERLEAEESCDTDEANTLLELERSCWQRAKTLAVDAFAAGRNSEDGGWQEHYPPDTPRAEETIRRLVRRAFEEGCAQGRLAGKSHNSEAEARRLEGR